MRLPNCQRAVLRIEKLRDYSLNPWHDAGKHKARVFRSALGITNNEAEWLRGRILELVCDAEAYLGEPSLFGRKYVVDILIQYRGREVPVRTSWIIDHGADFPRMTSCYVL